MAPIKSTKIRPSKIQQPSALPKYTEAEVRYCIFSIGFKRTVRKKLRQVMDATPPVRKEKRRRKLPLLQYVYWIVAMLGVGVAAYGTLVQPKGKPEQRSGSIARSHVSSTSPASPSSKEGETQRKKDDPSTTTWDCR